MAGLASLGWHLTAERRPGGARVEIEAAGLRARATQLHRLREACGNETEGKRLRAGFTGCNAVKVLGERVASEARKACEPHWNG